MIIKKKFQKLYRLSKQYRIKLLEVSQQVQAIHIGGSFSCLEILNTIYNIFNRKNNINFILSKGHTAIAQYIILNQKKIISNKQLKLYCKKEGDLGVHPEISTKGIMASTGSLGHGLAMTAGLAIADKKKDCFCVLSDGELMEGSVWEAVLMISSLDLNNIIVVVDFNGLQSSTFSKDTHKSLQPIDQKFKAFGWDTAICDGHKIEDIENKILNRQKSKPFALIAKTIKGYPVSFMMNKPIWHYRSPSDEEFLKAKGEINEK